MAQLPEVRDMFKAASQVVLAEFARVFDGRPPLHERGFAAGWKEQANGRHLPYRRIEWGQKGDIVLMELPTFRASAQFLERHPKVGKNFRGVVGTKHSAGTASAENFIFEFMHHMIYKPSGASLQWDAEWFEQLYVEVEHALLSTTIDQIYWIPMLGLEGEFESMPLGQSVVLRRMSDDELGALVDLNALPVHHVENRYVTGIQIPHHLRWAVVKETKIPRIFEESPPDGKIHTRTGIPKDIDMVDIAERVATALRLVAGGAVTYGGLATMRKRGLIRTSGGYSMLSRPVLLPPQTSRCTLSSTDTGQVLELFEALGHANLRNDRRIGLAGKRIRDATLRLDPEDGLIDCMIAAEAIFLSDSSSDRTELGYRLTLRAGLFLAPESELKPSEIQAFLRRCYKARSHLVHGSHPKEKDLVDPRGRRVTLVEFCQVLETLVRHALRKMIQLQATRGDSAYKWEEMITATIDSANEEGSNASSISPLNVRNSTN